jgi:hypothetical protein
MRQGSLERWRRGEYEDAEAESERRARCRGIESGEASRWRCCECAGALVVRCCLLHASLDDCCCLFLTRLGSAWLRFSDPAVWFGTLVCDLGV